MKKLMALLLALVMVFALVACGTGAPAGESAKPAQTPSGGNEKTEKVVTISFWLEPFPEWEKYVYEQTGIKIEYDQVESKNYFDIMTTRLQGGNAADIVYAYNADADRMYIEAGYAVDLSNYAWLDQVLPMHIRDAQRAGNGKVYSLSENVSYANVLFYNKDIFEANNIKVPQNIDEFMAVCQQLKDLGITPFIHGNGEANHLKRTPFEPINIVTAQEGGADWVKGLATGESKFTDDIFVKAAGYFEKIVQNGYMSDLSNGITHVEAWELFTQGEAAMMTGASFYADQNYGPVTPDFEVGVVPCPYNYEGTPKNLLAIGVNTIMVNANSKNVDVALEYMEFYVTHWKEYAAISGRPMAYVGDADWAPYAWIFAECGKYEGLPYVRETSLIQKDLEAWTQGVLAGGSATAGLKDLDARLADAIK